MKKIPINKACKSLAEYAINLEHEPLVILKRGKPLAVLSSVKGSDIETIAVANSPTFARIIARSRARYEKEGGISSDEVRRRLGLPPAKTRRKRS